MIEFVFMGLLYLLILYFVFWVGLFVSRLWFPVKAFIYLVSAFVGYQMVLEASGVFAVAVTLFTGVCFFILPYLGIFPAEALQAGFIGVPRYFWETFLAKKAHEKILKQKLEAEERLHSQKMEAEERLHREAEDRAYREREKMRQEQREDEDRFKEWAKKYGGAEELKFSDLDPYEVLGVDRSATESEIKKRKNEMLIKFHPDTVASYGAEVQKQAEAMTKLVNWASSQILG